MKKITFSITLYGWKDFKKWFWDLFCFPRRKIVVQWLDFHNDNLQDEICHFYYDKEGLDYSKTEDMYKYNEFCNKVKEIIKKQTENTTFLIMQK